MNVKFIYIYKLYVSIYMNLNFGYFQRILKVYNRIYLAIFDSNLNLILKSDRAPLIIYISIKIISFINALLYKNKLICLN